MKQEIKERIEMIQRGEVPKGYKKSKVGIIPMEWDVIPVKNLGTIVTGNTPSTGNSDYYGKGYHFASPADISEKKYVDNTENSLTKKGFEVSRKVPANSVLVTCIGSTIGKIAKAKIEMSINQQINAVVCSSKYDSDYVYYSLGYYFDIIKKSATSTQAVPIINKTLFSKTLIPQPHWPEAQTIASILFTWDRAIELKEQLIEEKKKLKKGLMQNLLTGKVRVPGFEGEWVEVQLADILDYEQPTKYLVKDILGYSRELIPVLTANKTFIIGSTKDKHGVYTDCPVIIFDDFTMDNKYVDFPFKVKSSAIKMLKPKANNVDIKFVYELMQLINFPVGEHKRYYLSEYQHTYVCLPSQEEQSYIAGISKAADSEIALLEQELALLKQQKQGLMQLLLTGIVRVPV